MWGDGAPELVLLHGGAQNAHTWDTVALALGRPLVAIDLPGHGHSDWRTSGDYRPQAMAGDITAVAEQLAPDAPTLVGMSLGGLTALTALATTPSLAEHLVLVDITPGVNQEKDAALLTVIPTTSGNGSIGGGPWSRFSSQYATVHSGGVLPAMLVSARLGVSTCLPKLACGSLG